LKYLSKIRNCSFRQTKCGIKQVKKKHWVSVLQALKGMSRKTTLSAFRILSRSNLSKGVQQMAEFSDHRELCLNRVEGRDFRIRRGRRESSVVLHHMGGTIEPVTSRLAVATAGRSFSWYCFEGLRGNRGNIHITSSNFDEPRCLELIASCDVVLAIHGRTDDGDLTTIFAGGLHESLRNAIALELNEAGFSTTSDSPKYAGRARSNIWNRGRLGRGVQLEIPGSLRDELDDDEVLFNHFVGVLGRTTRARS
jgi:phage replication-related protein YjqB (UPF0714/DUF867 family)